MESPAFAEIVETFEIIDDWDERYRYIIDLGRELPTLDSRDRNDANKVDGCVSQVWLALRVERNGGTARLYFDGDSDAHITRGLIAILRALYSGQTLSDVASIDVAGALGKLDLASHISRQRSNGLQAMVRRIRTLAEAAV